MSSILDLGLASGESAAALGQDIGPENEAVKAARAFFDDVQHNIIFIDSFGPVSQASAGDMSSEGWKRTHAKYLAYAEDIFRLLSPFSVVSKKVDFREWFTRFGQKLADAQKLEIALT
jgi:hypothetical protein